MGMETVLSWPRQMLWALLCGSPVASAGVAETRVVQVQTLPAGSPVTLGTQPRKVCEDAGHSLGAPYSACYVPGTEPGRGVGLQAEPQGHCGKPRFRYSCSGTRILKPAGPGSKS